MSTICDVTCPTDCLQCDYQGKCTRCKTGFFINGNSCVTPCPQYYISDSIQCVKCDTNCLRCQQDGRCVECRSGLSLTSTGNCVSPSCPLSELISSSTSCASCLSPCLTCTAVPTQCTSCTNSTYLISSNSTCNETCPSDQFADTMSRTCRACRSSCKTCQSFENCTKCISDYYLWNVSSKATYCLSECPPGTYI